MTPLSSTSTNYHDTIAREQNVIGNNPRSQSLRPASYIKVTDLANSYNINVEKMKVEIERIRHSKSDVDGNVGETVLVDTKEDSHSMISKVTDDSASTGEKKLREVVASKGYPKRFSAMNGGFNLCLLVGNVDIVVDKLRVDKSRVRLAEVQVGDETGSISLRARDEQIDALEKVSEEGGAIVLRNSSIELFQGKFLRLAVSKWGKINVYPDHVASTPNPPTTLNVDLDLSIVDLTRGPADMWLQAVSNSPTIESTTQVNKPVTQSISHHQNQQYRKKGRGSDRRNIPQQAFQPHLTKIPTRQDYSYNQMMGITQGMTGNPISYAYPGAQYYSGYDDATIHSMHHKQRIEQQKQQISQQQLLYMQQQHYQLQRQMQQMERFLYNQSATQHQMDPSTMSQASGDMVNDVHHDADPLGRAHMTATSDQSDVRQSHVDSHDISDNRSISWSVTGDNMMTMEVPMSPQMNPHAASFAPHYQVPDLGSGSHQGQQQYYVQPQQTPDYSSYSATAYYPKSPAFESRRDDSHASNDQQSSKNA